MYNNFTETKPEKTTEEKKKNMTLRNIYIIFKPVHFTFYL